MEGRDGAGVVWFAYHKADRARCQDVFCYICHSSSTMSHNQPASLAGATAAARLRASSLTRTREMRELTVCGLRFSSAAI